MRGFSEAELDFLRSERTARVATVSPAGWPHVMPVRYELVDGGELEFDADGAKLRNMIAAPRAALVVDAGAPRRGISVQGDVVVVGHERVRLTPRHVFSWGLDGR